MNIYTVYNIYEFIQSIAVIVEKDAAVQIYIFNAVNTTAVMSSTDVVKTERSCNAKLSI